MNTKHVILGMVSFLVLGACGGDGPTVTPVPREVVSVSVVSPVTTLYQPAEGDTAVVFTATASSSAGSAVEVRWTVAAQQVATGSTVRLVLPVGASPVCAVARAASGAESTPACVTVQKHGRIVGKATSLQVQGRENVLDLVATLVFGSTTETARIRPDLTFAFSGAARSASSAQLFIDVAPPRQRYFLPSLIADIRPNIDGVGVVMIPKSYAIGQGVHQGLASVDLPSAFAPTPDSTSFYFSQARTIDRALVTWPNLPIKVALNRDSTRGAFAPGDSAQMWAVLEEINRQAGVRFFEPAQYNASAPTQAWVAKDDTTVGSYVVKSFTRATGDLVRARVYFGAKGTENDIVSARSIVHEFGHVLGLGHHQGGWQSAMVYQGVASVYFSRLDMAHLLLLYEERTLFRQGYMYGLPEALAAIVAGR